MNTLVVYHGFTSILTRIAQQKKGASLLVKTNLYYYYYKESLIWNIDSTIIKNC